MNKILVKNIFILSTFIGLFLGCESKSKKEINKLKFKNDSLLSIIDNLNNKYIFDSITVRDIPSFRNTYEKGSYVSGEVVIVAYNSNIRTNVIFGDSIYYKDSDLNLNNPDTLKLQRGGFTYRKKLEDTLKIEGVVNVFNKHGKEKQILIKSIIKSND